MVHIIAVAIYMGINTIRLVFATSADADADVYELATL